MVCGDDIIGIVIWVHLLVYCSWIITKPLARGRSGISRLPVPSTGSNYRCDMSRNLVVSKPILMLIGILLRKFSELISFGL